MIWSIAKKVFYNNMVSARFLTGFILCVLLIPLTTLINIKDYQGKMRAYEVELNWAEEQENVRVYSFYRPRLVKPPEPLSIFCKGITYNVGNRVRIWLNEKPTIARGESNSRDNPFLNRFLSLDFITVLSVLLSLFALIFTYDFCVGEKEQGTLRLLFSNSIGRSKFLTGKLIGELLTLIPILLFCYVLSVVIILVYPEISFSLSDWGRIILMLIMSILLMFFFMTLGIVISAKTKTSSTSIIICLLCWIAFVFIIPNMANYAAKSFIKIGSIENVDFKLDEIHDEFEEEYDAVREKYSRDDIWFSHFNHNTGWDGRRRLVGTAKKTYEYYRKFHGEVEPIRIEYAHKKWPVQKAYLDELDKQRRLAEILSFLSPYEVSRLTATSLCKTDVLSHYDFMDDTRNYWKTFTKYFLDNKIFESYAYFTPVPPEKYWTADQLIEYSTEGKIKSLEELRIWEQGRADILSIRTRRYPEYFWNHEYYPFLDLSDLPKFIYNGTSIARSITSSLIKISFLLLASIILFYVAFISFIKYDVR